MTLEKIKHYLEERKMRDVEVDADRIHFTYERRNHANTFTLIPAHDDCFVIIVQGFKTDLVAGMDVALEDVLEVVKATNTVKWFKENDPYWNRY